MYGYGLLANHISDRLTGNDHRSENQFLHPVRRLRQVLLWMRFYRPRAEGLPSSGLPTSRMLSDIAKMGDIDADEGLVEG